MASAPFICDVEGSEETLKTAVKSHQLRHRVCSYTILQVFVGVLTVLILALTGGVIWMKLFQETGFKDCPGKLWTVRFTGTNANFTSPRTQKYMIFGSVFTKDTEKDCKNSFYLQQILPNVNKPNEIIKKLVTEVFDKDDVELWKDATLSVQFNCKVSIDEDKSKLFIYEQNSC